MKSVMALSLLLTAASPAPRAVSIDRAGATLEFTTSWPAEAAAIPALDRRLRAQTEKAFRQARKEAANDLKMSREEKIEFNKQSYLMAWSSAGQSKQLLALQSERFTFTGGAHPNTDYGALLWDRGLARVVTPDSLFAAAGGLAAATRAAYCAALDAERLKRREGVRLGGEYDQCPKYSELAISPIDGDRNGRFDRLDFVASPYVAGAYAEGEYVVKLPVTRALIAALKPAYRVSFEPQRQ